MSIRSFHLTKPLVTALAEPGPRQSTLQVKPTLNGQEGDVMPIREIRLETFEPELHSQILGDWLRQPHVVPWWGDSQLALESSLQNTPETCAVIVVDGAPVGYLSWHIPSQDELKAAGLVDLPEDLVDIDILIGESELIDRGVGPRSLCLLLSRFREDPLVSVAGVGTSVRNGRAIRAFEKAGFRLLREFQNPEFGSCWYMVVDVCVNDRELR